MAVMPSVDIKHETYNLINYHSIMSRFYITALKIP